jgi:hypothetical protein
MLDFIKNRNVRIKNKNRRYVTLLRVLGDRVCFGRAIALFVIVGAQFQIKPL